MKKNMLFLMVSVFLFGAVSVACAGEKLMVYTSMKESLIGSLRDAFVKKHPDIAFDYYSAGAGKLMAKIAAERQSGKMTVDVLWHSEVPDFYKLKQDGLLEKYVSPEAKYMKSPVTDPDSYFTPARLATLGIAYNTKKVTNPPKGWNDLLDPRFKGGFGIANPAISGTAFVSVAMMVNTMGGNTLRNWQRTAPSWDRVQARSSTTPPPAISWRPSPWTSSPSTRSRKAPISASSSRRSFPSCPVRSRS